MRMRRLVLAGLCLMLGAGAPPDPAARLLDALRAAPDAADAAALQERILLVWRQELTPAVRLLADHAVAAIAQQDQKAAIGDLDAALDLQPDQADLWRLHAEARFAAGDTRGAYADLAQALVRDPKCFPALADLSHVAEASGDDAKALSAWQQLLLLDPQIPQGSKRLKELEQKISGSPL